MAIGRPPFFEEETLTLTGDQTLVLKDTDNLLVTASGTNRNLTLPTADAAFWSSGAEAKITNVGTSNNVVIKNSDATTLDTLEPGEYGRYYASNGTWHIGDSSNLGTGSASQLSDLSDVGVTTPTNRNALMADGDSWESRAIVEADISDLNHTGDPANPGSGTELAEVTIDLCEDATPASVGWTGAEFATNPYLDATNMDTGAGQIRAQMSFDGTDDTNKAKFYKNRASAYDASGYKYVEFNVAWYDTGGSVGPTTRLELHISASDDLATPHTTYVLGAIFHDANIDEVAPQIDNGTHRKIRVPLGGTSIKSYGFIEVIAGNDGAVKTDLAFDSIKVLAADESQVEEVTNGSVLIPDDFSPTGGGQEYTKWPSTHRLDVVNKNWSWFRREKNLLDILGSGRIDGSADVWLEMQQIIDNLDPNDKLYSPPDAKWLLNTNQKLKLLRKRDLRFNMNGSWFIAGANLDTAMWEVYQSENIQIYDMQLLGGLTNKAGSTKNGNTWTEVTATTADVSTTKTLTGANAAAKTLLSTEGWLARDIDGWVRITLNISGTSGVIAGVSLLDGDGNTITSDGKFEIERDSSGFLETASYIRTETSATQYNIRYRPRDVTHHIYLVVTNIDAAGVVTIHDATATGARDDASDDAPHGIQVDGSQNTFIYDTHGRNFEGDFIKIDGDAFNTRIERFYTEMQGRQGIADVRSTDTTIRNGDILNSGRHNIDIESFTGSQFIVRPVLDNLRMSGGRLGGIACLNAHLIESPKYTNLYFEKIPLEGKIIEGGGREAIFDNIVSVDHIDRDTGAASSRSVTSFVGRNMKITNVYIEGEQGLVNIGDGGGGVAEGARGFYHNIKAGAISFNATTTTGDTGHANTVISGYRGVPVTSANVNTALANRGRNMPVNVTNASEKIFITDIYGGGIGGYSAYGDDFSDPETHTATYGMSMRHVGGQDLYNETIKRAGGLTSGMNRMGKLDGYYSSVDRSTGSQAVLFSEAQYNRANFSHADMSDGVSPTDGGTGGSLLSSTTYYYRSAAIYPGGGSLPAKSETNITTPAGSNDHKNVLTQQDMENRAGYSNLIRGLRLWRGTASNTYSHYVDIIPDETNNLALLVARWDYADSGGQSFTDDGTNVTIDDTENVNWTGYANSGVFAWQTTPAAILTGYASDWTGQEQNTNYIIIPSIELVTVGNTFITNVATTGFTFNWTDTTAGTFNWGYLIVGR